ncbi:MAG TPA: ABC transporter permease [Pyrinomonadaceae bacterium]|jgi:ABC-type antimicrobial peptide transport system permease subunit
MSFFDILRLALRNLRESKLRALLTTTGVIIGVAVVISMISFGLGLQRDALSRFQNLDGLSEIHVFGRSLFSLAANQEKGTGARAPQPATPPQPAAQASGGEFVPDYVPERSLDDRALEEIAGIPGVVYVKPHINFSAYARANNRTIMEAFRGAPVPDPSTRLKSYAVGQMISSSDADEVVVTQSFIRRFGYAKPADAIGQTVEIMDAPPGKDDGSDSDPASDELVAARTYRIVGVLAEEPGGNRFRGLTAPSNIYLSLDAARSWKDEHPDPISRVALRLARKKGAVGSGQKVSFTTAVVRVGDPVQVSAVRSRLSQLGFGSFSFVDEFKQIRSIFLIINSALALLGGISLLVASLGIANTMLMSTIERTREIGIMKAIGAEDREIKQIFFVEASVIGLVGGIVGALLAWGLDELANRLAYRYILKPQGVDYLEFFWLPPYLWLGALALALLVSVLAALYPAARAARIDPVTALRHD